MWTYSHEWKCKQVNSHTHKNCTLAYVLKMSVCTRICCSSLPQSFIWSMVSAAMINSLSASMAGPPYKITQHNSDHLPNSTSLCRCFLSHILARIWHSIITVLIVKTESNLTKSTKWQPWARVLIVMPLHSQTKQPIFFLVCSCFWSEHKHLRSALFQCQPCASLTLWRIIFARCRYSWHWLDRNKDLCWIACTLQMREDKRKLMFRPCNAALNNISEKSIIKRYRASCVL